MYIKKCNVLSDNNSIRYHTFNLRMYFFIRDQAHEDHLNYEFVALDLLKRNPIDAQ